MTARVSIVRWFEIAEETLILQQVESYTENLWQRLVRHPRLHFFDVGVFNGLINNFTASPDSAGILFETFIANQLFSTPAALDEQISVNSFRTESGVEVDFVVRWRGVVYAIEVTASCHLGGHDIRGLRRFG